MRNYIDETKIIEIAKPYFDSARAGDWEHALRVVEWVKRLGKGRDGLGLIITSAYIHDIGWSGLALKGKINFDEMIKLEPLANENSPLLITEVLTKLDYTKEDITIVNRLVNSADRHRANLEDEVIMVDADNLSKLCIEHMTEKYEPASWAEVIKTFEEEFPKRIKTSEGKELFPKLLSELKTGLKLHLTEAPA